MYAFLYISGMTLYCYHELPVFDFRPYHIGADIRKGMEIPEGAKPTVYETRFILLKKWSGERIYIRKIIPIAHGLL